MKAKKAAAPTWEELLEAVIPLLRDAKTDCEVDCGPMALAKIDRALRLLTAARRRCGTGSAPAALDGRRYTRDRLIAPGSPSEGPAGSCTPFS